MVDPRGNATSQSIQMSASDAPQSISFGALTGGNSQADQTWTIQDTAGNTLATATINIDELVGLTLDHFNPDPVPNAGGIEMHVEAVGSVSNPNQLDDPLNFAWTVVDIGGNSVGFTDEGDHIVFGANPHGKYTVDLTVSDNYGNSQQGELSVDFSGGGNNPDPNNDPNNSDPNDPNNNNPPNPDPNPGVDPQPDPPPAPPVDPNPVDPTQPDPGSTDPGSSGPPTDQPPVQPPVDPPVVQHFGPSNIEIDGDTTVAPNSTASFSVDYTPGDRGGEEVVWWVYDYQGNQIADGEGQNITFATGEDGSYNVNALVINQDGEDQTAIDTTSNGPTNLQLTPSVQTPAVGQPVTVSATFDDVNKNSNGGPAGYSYYWTVADSKGNTVPFAFEQDKLTFSPPMAGETYTVHCEVTDPNDQTTEQDVDVASALPKVSISDVTQAEGNDGPNDFDFIVSLDSPSAKDVTVNVSTSDGTATTADNDYVALQNYPVTIKAGETSASFTVNVNGDNKYETDETFKATLSGAVGASIADAEATGTIVNDDPIPTLSFNSTANYEGNGGTTPLYFIASLSNPTYKTVDFYWTTQDGTAVSTGDAADYQAASGHVFIDPGQLTGDLIAVNVNGDTTVEQNETFNVVVDGGRIANANAPTAPGVGTILDDDDRPVAKGDEYNLNSSDMVLDVGADNGVLGNDIPSSTGDPVTLRAIKTTDATHGTVQLNFDGSLKYTLTDKNYYGDDSFQYYAQASNGKQSDVATVMIKRDDPPQLLAATMSTDAVGNNQAGPSLDHSLNTSEGAFVPVNDDDYDGTPDNQDSGTVTGEKDLLPITITGMDSIRNGGYVTLDIPANVRVWLHDDRSGGQVTNETMIDQAFLSGEAEVGGDSLTLYVEGMSVGAGTMALYWAPPADDDGAAPGPRQVDALNVQTFDFVGPANVPGNSTYTYTVDGANGAWTGQVVGGTATTGLEPTSLLNVKWDNAAVVGNASYDAAYDGKYVWDYEVNVVKIVVTASNAYYPEVEAASTLSSFSRLSPAMIQLFEQLIADPKTSLLQRQNYETILSTKDFNGSIYSIAAQENATFLVTVQLQGPATKPNAASHLELGLIQTYTTVQENASYAGGITLVNTMQGQTLLDTQKNSDAPWNDTENEGPEGDKTFWQPTANSSETLKLTDGPGFAFLGTADQSFIGDTSNVLESANGLSNLALYVAARTKDTGNGAENVYSEIASAEWTVDGSGVVDGSYQPTAEPYIQGTQFSTDNQGKAINIPATTFLSARDTSQWVQQ